jgi:membrane associated rhomboid family serine protease
VTQPTPETGVPTCYRHPGRESHIRCQRCDRPICPECMRDAAVGFQCVECVRAGAKETRSGRTAYGGLRPTDASATSIGLIVVNVAVWIGVVVTGGFSSRTFDWLALRPKGLCETAQGYYEPAGLTCSFGGRLMPGVSDGAYWQLVTSMFTHVELWHIAFNMIALWVYGPRVEAPLGRARFLALYFLSGLAGSAAVLWLGPEFGGTHGASGAVFGLLAAQLVIAFKVGGDVNGVAAWLGISFVGTLLIVDNVSWQGHLGGVVGGLACALVLVFAPKGALRARLQVAGLLGIGVVLAVAIAARTVMLGG